MVKFKNNIKYVNAETLIPTLGNPNYVPQSLFQSIIDDIKQNGFYGAILINNDNEIVDGEHRWRALKSLGVKEVPVIVDDELDKDTSRIQTIRLNRERGYLTPVETGQMLINLNENIPMDILAQSTSIPMPELTVLTNLKYDPTLQKDTELSSQKTSWADIDSIVNQLYIKIKESKLKFTEIYTISRGGLIPARLIADKLDIKIIHVDKEVPDNSLVIDDIYDSGRTFDDVTKGNETILFGTLFGRKGTKFPENSLIGQETIGNEYIVFPWDKQEYSRMQKLNS